MDNMDAFVKPSAVSIYIIGDFSITQDTEGYVTITETWNGREFKQGALQVLNKEQTETGLRTRLWKFIQDSGLKDLARDVAAKICGKSCKLDIDYDSDYGLATLKLLYQEHSMNIYRWDFGVSDRSTFSYKLVAGVTRNTIKNTIFGWLCDKTYTQEEISDIFADLHWLNDSRDQMVLSSVGREPHNSTALKVFRAPNTLELLSEIRALDIVCYPDTIVDVDWYSNNYSKLESFTVAVLNEQLVGYCCVTGIQRDILECYEKGFLQGDVSLAPNAFTSLEAADCYYISSVVVEESFRGQGIARKLLKAALRAIDVQHAALETSVCAVCQHDAVLKILLDNGFSVVQEIGAKKIMSKY